MATGSSSAATTAEFSATTSGSPLSNISRTTTSIIPPLSTPRPSYGHSKSAPNAALRRTSSAPVLPSQNVSSKEDEDVVDRVKSSLSASRYTTGRYFQKDLSTVCYRCSKVGHRVEECQEEEENPVERPCYLCARTNHLAKDCLFQLCKECGRQGHSKDDCVANIAVTASVDNVGLYAESSLGRFSFVDVQCMSCGNYGHLHCSNTAPKRPRKVYLCPVDIQNVDIYCANCGGRGHIYSSCRGPRVGSILGRDYHNDFVKCYNCDGIGHVGRLCPSKPTFTAPRQPPTRMAPRQAPVRQIIPPSTSSYNTHQHKRRRNAWFDKNAAQPSVHRGFQNQVQCDNCMGYGHIARHCPSAPGFAKRRRYR